MPGWRARTERWRKETAWTPADSPSGRAETDSLYLRKDSRMAGPTTGRTKPRHYLCVAKQFRAHPDAETRSLAYEQAREQHALNVVLSGIECPTKGQERFHSRCRDAELGPWNSENTRLMWHPLLKGRRDK